MLALRPLGPAGLRAYADELRPRMLVMRVRAGRVRFAWMVPLWPVEELVALVAGAALLAHAAWPLWAGAVGGRRWRLRTRLADVAGHAGAAPDARGTLAAVLAGLSTPAGSHPGDILRLPPGAPYLSIRSRRAAVDLTAY